MPSSVQSVAGGKRKEAPGSAKGSIAKKPKIATSESKVSGRWTKAENELFATLSARRGLLTHWNKFQSEWDKERDGKADVRSKSAKQLKAKHTQQLLTQKQRADRDAGKAKPKKSKNPADSNAAMALDDTTDLRV